MSFKPVPVKIFREQKEKEKERKKERNGKH
jgi:hypothetical protein